MTAYNGVNGPTCSANAELLIRLLRDEWGWDGVLMSDWYGTKDTVASARNGLDLEMPGPPRFFGDELAAAVRRGEVDEKSVLDEKARRMLRLLARTGALDEAGGAGARAGDRPRRAPRARAARRDRGDRAAAQRGRRAAARGARACAASP